MADHIGYIYILTNPSFPQYVKIGYADDVEKRLAQLNRSECIPFAFRIYATYEVQSLLPSPLQPSHPDSSHKASAYLSGC